MKLMLNEISKKNNNKKTLFAKSNTLPASRFGEMCV